MKKVKFKFHILSVPSFIKQKFEATYPIFEKTAEIVQSLQAYIPGFDSLCPSSSISR